MNLSPRKKLFVDTAAEMFGAGSVISKQDIRLAAEKAGVPVPTWIQDQCKVGYNQFKLPCEDVAVTAATGGAGSAGSEAAMVNLVATNMEKQDLVPTLFEGFVAWGHFSKIEKVIKSG